MNEELKKKIESARKDETYWNDEAMANDLIKQGYKKEDIDKILTAPKEKISDDKISYAGGNGFWSEVEGRIRLRGSLFLWINGTIILVCLLAIISSRIMILLYIPDNFIYPTSIFVLILSLVVMSLGFWIGLKKYKNKVIKLSPEQLPSKKYGNIPIIVICIVYFVPHLLPGGGYFILLPFWFAIIFA